jgi:hypothetical protein
MDTSNRYERAFESYLKQEKLCYVAVDETRRATIGEGPVKSLDFIVQGGNDARLLVDIKGRRFPTGAAGRQRRVWECWSTRDDVDGLVRWAALFGAPYQALLVFAYCLDPAVAVPDDTEDLWSWRGDRFLFRAVPVADYQGAMRVRSPKWGTVTLPNAAFRRLVRPLSFFTRGTAGLAR